MSQDWQIETGFALPLGATLTPNGVNFSVFSEHASQLFLCLFDEQEQPIESLPFRHKSNGIWHMEVLGLAAGQRYGLRAEGPFEPENLHVFNPNKLLIDPYSKALSSRLAFHPEHITLTPEGQMDTQDSAATIPKSIVRDVTPANPASKPSIDPRRRCLYEMHIKGFSQQLDIEEALKGKYLGASSEQAIRHLTELGITSVQLMPCFAFADEIHLQEKGLTNYWGYNPVNFFTPDDRYACDDAVSECQTMIQRFHEAGLEVILDVVYNHTNEGEIGQGTSCYRGLDNAVYYRHENGQYLNYTGCGNCVDTYHPATLRLICDSMRYWVEVMGVDGFRFDLGVDLGREAHDFSPKSPLLQAILQDPVLSQVQLISEPWDIGPNGYQVGQFPDRFLECNDQYRDTVRRFWRKDTQVVPEFATRIMGSRDIFHKGAKDALHSVNFITYHDGFTLNDLVSYHHRHNLDNHEQNNDGHGDNISQNFGIEGPTDDADINAARLNQQLCFLATLLLSQGTPHLLGGDERSHTQHGNNNAYCQDNEITWLDWQADNNAAKTLQTAVSDLLRLRQQYPVLANARLEDDPLFAHQEKDHISWFNESGAPMGDADWHKAGQAYLSLTLQAADQPSQIWLVFYREDGPITISSPASQSIKEVLFATGSVQCSKNNLSLETRSVLLIELES